MNNQFSELVTNLKALTEGREAGGGKSKGELRLPGYPKAPQYRAWCNKVRAALCTHVPKRADDVLSWVLKVYEPGATREQFADSGPFPELDVELANAIVGIVHGELAREVNAFVDAQQRQRIVPRGRQLLWMVHMDHQTNEEFGAIYNITDLIKVQWLGDNKMRQFQSNWDAVIAGCGKDGISERDQLALYLERLEKSDKLKADVAAYRRLPNSEKSYEVLRSALGRQLEIERHAANRLAQQQALGDPAAAGLVANDPKGKGKKGDSKGRQ